MSSGWMPGVTIAKSPNFTAGRAGRKIQAAIQHVAAGGYASSISWLCKATTKASAHFMVGKAGQITQMVSIWDTAWGNGLAWDGHNWTDPEKKRVNPSWPLLTPGVDPNSVTVSIEHEGQPGDVWTQAMFDATVKILQYVKSETGLVYTALTTLTGHFAISPVDRPNCPGPHADYAALAAAGNGATVQTTATQTQLRPGSYRVIGGIDFAAVREDRSTTSPIALGGQMKLPVGYGVEIDDITSGWSHLATGEGFVSSDLLTPVDAGDLTFLHAPRCTCEKFIGVLSAAKSPALAAGKDMYGICVSNAVDPATFLAFFGHENSYGTAGLCASHDLRNPGDVRHAMNAARGEQLTIPGHGDFFQYYSWQGAVADWCERMIANYINAGHATVRDALTIYAPTSDGNAPSAYANAVVKNVAAWAKG